VNPPSGSHPGNLFSLCNRPPWALASVLFQEDPTPLSIGRTVECNRRLFKMLDAEPDPARRGAMFHDYLSVQFALHQWADHDNTARSSLRNSYVRYLRGWSVDSNSLEGAVLKGWVERRIGIPATFHHTPLVDDASLGRYAADRVNGSARTNAIDQQLDLLFEFSQYELRRRHAEARWLTLYRGTFDANGYETVAAEGVGDPVVRMNNLSSFTSDRECAWEFGSTVWEVKVPLAKIFFFSDLLPDSILRGEQEFLVIGGEYRVHKLLF
jgi:NAD+--dinitrogen-reductase ADP-D-ribosyltransferase